MRAWGCVRVGVDGSDAAQAPGLEGWWWCFKVISACRINEAPQRFFLGKNLCGVQIAKETVCMHKVYLIIHKLSLCTESSRQRSYS